MKLTLKISSTSHNLSTEEVATVLAKNMVTCTVYKTTSVVVGQSKKSSWIENGCDIEVHDIDTKEDVRTRVWEPLKERFDLTCGHIYVRGRGYSGCVYNFFKEEKCPFDKRADIIVYRKEE